MSESWDAEETEDTEQQPRLPASAARVLEGVVELGWTADAGCVSIDPELWFPDIGRTAPRAVVEICAACPVRRSCLATALVNFEDGIWGGVQERSRRRGRVQIGRGADPLVVLDELLERAADTGNRRRFAA